MYHVLLAVDKSEPRAEAGARAVVDLPGDEETRVTVFHCFTDNPAGASAVQVESVRVARDRLQEHGIETTIDESSGNPADVLVEAAEELEADLIVVAGRERSPTGKAVFGSVTQAVILNSDRPVLVTGTGDRT